MKANEFLKENGLKKCSRIVEDLIEQGNDSEFVKDLKRLVDAHEFVECYGGLHMARADAMDLDGWEKTSPYWVKIKQAIADVESCK